MADLFAGQPIPVEEKVAELRRELRQREHVYPRLVATGKLKQDRADRQVAVLQAILADYEEGRVCRRYAQPCAKHEYIERDCPDCGWLA